jgi:hypothetical protein
MEALIIADAASAAYQSDGTGPDASTCPASRKIAGFQRGSSYIGLAGADSAISSDVQCNCPNVDQ